VVVLSFNHEQFLGPCLESLSRQTWPVEIVLVDNGSVDQSAETGRALLEKLGLKGVVHRLEENRGCAGGNNFGWRQATANVVLFLNPDTELEPDCVENLVEPLLENEGIGVTGAKMYFPGGKVLQHAGGIVHPNGMTNHHGAGDGDKGQFENVRDVDYVTGAALAIRRSVLEELGGFDEDYFPAYYEEVDLCLKVRRAGRRVIYVPTAVLVHHESPALGRGSRALHKLFPRMRVRYLLKNLSARQVLGWAVPFEVRWMLKEPAARGHRWEQIRYGWLGNLGWLARHVTRSGEARDGERKKI